MNFLGPSGFLHPFPCRHRTMMQFKDFVVINEFNQVLLFGMLSAQPSL